MYIFKKISLDCCKKRGSGFACEANSAAERRQTDRERDAVIIGNTAVDIFIVAPCILKIHLVSRTKQMH
jgi:hypothetical protein